MERATAEEVPASETMAHCFLSFVSHIEICISVMAPALRRAAAVACTVAAVTVRQSAPVLELLGLPLDAKYLLLCLAALLWGTSRAGGNVVDSSLADSVPTGVPDTTLLTHRV